MFLTRIFQWHCGLLTCRIANISTFLCNWDPMLVDDFKGKLWDNNTEQNGNQEVYGHHSLHGRMVRTTFLWDLWPEHTSPFDSHQLQHIDEREEELLKRLKDGMQELEELDKEINHCCRRATEIHKLLGFPGIALQP
ncbi:hypothetical protein PAXRUDRAFT_152651 [Paxillus rubicundulus Ve08.2h10]|uniref:Uncharacterized protein n=1 Tax=Paxillus rubicundulus Ve08.2h10 TaxID=930991 RepID=A0A0D0D9E2_9AGAM|nr:hypothetical protein PAXRUDRAFT_152651 [Paxillus rubicundulus Ve08.2h10]